MSLPKHSQKITMMMPHCHPCYPIRMSMMHANKPMEIWLQHSIDFCYVQMLSLWLTALHLNNFPLGQGTPWTEHFMASLKRSICLFLHQKRLRVAKLGSYDDAIKICYCYHTDILATVKMALPRNLFGDHTHLYMLPLLSANIPLAKT